MIVNPSLFQCISSFQIHDPNILFQKMLISVKKKYIWEEQKFSEYINNLKLQEEKFRTLTLHLSSAKSQQEIDENMGNFVKIMDDICHPLFSKNLPVTRTENFGSETKKSSRPWFDDGCRQARSIFYKELNNYRRDRNSVNQGNLVKARSHFKRTIRQKGYIFENEKTNKLIVVKHKNAKEYWKLLKQASNTSNKTSVSAKGSPNIFKQLTTQTICFISRTKTFCILMNVM